MENNFYVGDIYYSKRNKNMGCTDKVVLYSDDNFYYLDLISGKWYNTDSNENDYVIKDSIIPTDINQYRENYRYLLSKYNDRTIKKKMVC